MSNEIIEVAYDQYNQTWIVDTSQGIKSLWGNILSGWKHMSEEALLSNYHLLDSLRVANPEEEFLLLQRLGLGE